MRRVLTLAAAAGLSALAFVGLTAAQAVANHVHCGDVITQDTTLDSDLIGCHGPGVEIGANDVTLDLAGHTIESDGQTNFANGHGVRATDRQGVTVENGVIRNFTVAQVELVNVTDSTVQELQLTGDALATSGVRVGGVSQRNAVRHNTITSASPATIIEGRGVAVNQFGTPSPQLEQNAISQNTISGYGRGIVIQSSEANLITGNDIRQGGFNGVQIQNAADGNLVQGNTMAAFAFGGPGNAVVEVFDSDRNVLMGNSVIGGPINGITVGFGADATRTEDNEVLRNGADGVLVSQSATETVVRGNQSDRNGDDGIDVENPSALVSGNHTWFNGDLGIEAVPGTAGSGNWSKHNGNPAQCENVSCSTTGKPKT
jgi:parallel beta-helix repeat protein